MALCRSSGIITKWILTQTHCIFFAAGRQTGSKHRTMIKTVLFCFIWGWTPAVFNGRVMPPKHGCLPGRNTDGLWKGFPLTSPGRYVHHKKGISRPYLWKTENLKLFFLLLGAGKRKVIHTTADFQEAYPQIAAWRTVSVNKDPAIWWISPHFQKWSTHQKSVKMPMDVSGPVCRLPCFPL